MARLVLLALFAFASPSVVAQQSEPVTLQVTVERPAELVARMARQAMGFPADPEGWSALADALPDLALLGGADLESTLEAARIADSLSASAIVGSPSGATWTRTLRSVLPVLQERWIDLVLALLVTALAGAGVARLRRGQTMKSTVPRRDRRVWAARSLATTGLSAHEIARRTGVAQDAVHVLIGMAGGRFGPVRTTRLRARKPVTIAEARAAELQRESRLAARRLRDQRLTYGPGARA